MLNVQHLSVRYGDKTAVDDVSFSVFPGQWWMIVGPNGAGKSTLIEAIARGVPYSGRIEWDGRDAVSFRSTDYAQMVGILSQTRHVEYAFTVRDVVSLGRYAYKGGFLRAADREGPRQIEDALRLTGLIDMQSRRLTTLSGGEMQRVFLAQTLAQNPRLLILDEPANHLDLKFQRDIFALISEWLRQPGKAVLSVVHDLSLARRLGTHAVLLQNGRCFCQGEISAVMTPARLRQVFGMDVYAWMRDALACWRE